MASQTNPTPECEAIGTECYGDKGVSDLFIYNHVVINKLLENTARCFFKIQGSCSLLSVREATCINMYKEAKVAMSCSHMGVM